MRASGASGGRSLSQSSQLGRSSSTGSRLGTTLRGPCPYRQRERRRREQRATTFAKLLAAPLVETGDVDADRTDAERVRLPPVLERVVLDVDRELAVLDLRCAGGVEEPREVAFGRPDERRLVTPVRVERSSGFPEQAERPAAAGCVIPDACGDDPARLGHAPHLREPRDGIG